MISINFASRNYQLMNRLLKSFAFINVLLVLAAVVLVAEGLSLRSDISVMEKKVKEMEAAEAQYLPLLNERNRIVSDLTAMSALMSSRRFSWTQLLTNTEKIFPVGVALAQFEFNPRDRGLNLDGTAQSPEALTNLMVGLERTAAFKDPYLKHQSVDKGSIFFNVVAFYNEPNTAGVGQGK